MCNKVHYNETTQPMNTTGFAWKVFEINHNDNDSIKSPYTNALLWENMANAKSQLIEWDPKLGVLGDDGFCVMLNPEDAKRISAGLKDIQQKNRLYYTIIVQKVWYRGGIASFLTNEINGQLMRVGIVKSFRIAIDQGHPPDITAERCRQEAEALK